MFLVTWLIFAAIFNAVGLPVVGLLSALASAAFCALLMWNRKLDLAKTHAKAVLNATSEGHLVDGEVLAVEYEYVNGATWRYTLTFDPTTSTLLAWESTMVDAVGDTAPQVR